MSKKRPSFTPEFKLEAVSLVTDKGYSLSEACQALGVGPTLWNSLANLDTPRASKRDDCLIFPC
jgi:transposase-like protein